LKKPLFEIKSQKLKTRKERLKPLFRKLFPDGNRIRKKGKSKRFFYGLLKTWVWPEFARLEKPLFEIKLQKLKTRPERTEPLFRKLFPHRNQEKKI
jgi:hypothetical protein